MIKQGSRVQVGWKSLKVTYCCLAQNQMKQVGKLQRDSGICSVGSDPSVPSLTENDGVYPGN